MEKFDRIASAIKGRMTDYFNDTVNDCSGDIVVNIYQEDFYYECGMLHAEFNIFDDKIVPVLTYSIALICLDGL